MHVHTKYILPAGKPTRPPTYASFLPPSLKFPGDIFLMDLFSSLSLCLKNGSVFPVSPYFCVRKSSFLHFTALSLSLSLSLSVLCVPLCLLKVISSEKREGKRDTQYLLLPSLQAKFPFLSFSSPIFGGIKGGERGKNKERVLSFFPFRKLLLLFDVSAQDRKTKLQRYFSLHSLIPSCHLSNAESFREREREGKNVFRSLQ